MIIPTDFSGKNKELIEQFQRHLELRGIKESTISNKVWLVRNLVKYYENKPLDELGKSEIEDYILHRRKTKKPKTAHNDMVEIRVFYNWLKPENNYFENLKRGRQKIKLPTNNPINPKDIRQLLTACQLQRDRAIVSLTYDSGARISEVLNLNVGDIEFDQYGGIVTVDGKTGMRRIRLVNSVPEIQLWLNQHPYKDNPNTPLFTTSRKKEGKFRRMSIRTVQNIFKKLANYADIKKNIHPHALRHGRLTELVKSGMKEMELRIFAGWGPDSDMPATYLHIAEEDVDKRILNINGIVTEEDNKQKDESLKPQKCPRCRCENPPDAKYCNTCSFVLDDKAAMTLKEDSAKTADQLAKAMNNPEFVAKVTEILQQQNA